jgi:hypothetical protein
MAIVSEWDRKLSEWTASGLVSVEQAAEIRSHEATLGPAPPPPAVEAESEPSAASSQVSPAIEAVGYVGAALAAAAAMVFLGGFFPNLTAGAQVALATLLTAVLLGGGVLLRSATPAALRLKSVLWVACVLAAAATGALFAGGVLDLSESGVSVVSSATAVAFAALLWAMNRSTLQNVAFLVTACAASVSIMVWANDDFGPGSIGFAIWAIGVVWAFLAWGGVLTPTSTGMIAGSIGALLGAQVAASGAYRGWGLTLGVLTVIVVLSAGVRLSLLGLLIAGGVGALVFAVQVSVEVFESELAAALALLLTGSLLVVGAVTAARRKGQAES